MMERPTWSEHIEAVCLAGALGFERGRVEGLREAADELDADVLRERAAEVIRNVVADWDTTPAREGRARAAARGWAA